jgi:hypothetical protein
VKDGRRGGLRLDWRARPATASGSELRQRLLASGAIVPRGSSGEVTPVDPGDRACLRLRGDEDVRPTRASDLARLRQRPELWDEIEREREERETKKEFIP